MPVIFLSLLLPSLINLLLLQLHGIGVFVRPSGAGVFATNVDSFFSSSSTLFISFFHLLDRSRRPSENTRLGSILMEEMANNQQC
ncbi:hypothetical protein CKAN_00171100 [Cinnamomum micranthum f. kanehirae]|uniref:Secreted protein n=1 Tax=Cinnamomum micranthum f. kanehirae TaxID=337451 RepID=A0A443N4J3_9MAGN|nr:hypothetical protein CKAN_00171100 [Cinnamomum micranthum f. kanehirae]